MPFPSNLASIITKYEKIAFERPDQAISIRDEFIDFDLSDEESVERAERRYEAFLKKRFKHEKSKGRLKTALEFGTHVAFDDTEVNKKIISRQQEKFNQTIAQESIDLNETDGYLCRTFMEKIGDRGRDLCPMIEEIPELSEEDEDEQAGATYVVQGLDETIQVGDEDQMYAHQATLMAHATNAISQRIRRIHGGLHQGSFGDGSLNLTVAQVNDMHSSVNAMYHDGTLMYSESEEETHEGKGTYVNIENFTTGDTLINGTTKSLVHVEADGDGNYRQLGTKRRSRKVQPKLVIEESDDSSDELARNFEQLRVKRRSSSTFMNNSPSQVLADYEQANYPMTPSQRRKLGIRREKKSLAEQVEMTKRTVNSILQSPNIRQRRLKRRLLGEDN